MYVSRYLFLYVLHTKFNLIFLSFKLAKMQNVCAYHVGNFINFSKITLFLFLALLL